MAACRSRVHDPGKRLISRLGEEIWAGGPAQSNALKGRVGGRLQIGVRETKWKGSYRFGPTAELVSEGLVIAASRVRPNGWVVHHSDRGAAQSTGPILVVG